MVSKSEQHLFRRRGKHCHPLIANKMGLAKRMVREVLERLKQERCPMKSGSFFFFNEDEMQVQTIEGHEPDAG